MANFEAELTKDQTDLLIGGIDYISGAADRQERTLPHGAQSESVETDSGIFIKWFQTPITEVSDPNEYFGLLELDLEEDTGKFNDVKTTVTYAVSKDGVSCEAREEFDTAGGHTDRTIKRTDIDKTARNMTRLLNRIFI